MAIDGKNFEINLTTVLNKAVGLHPMSLQQIRQTYGGNISPFMLQVFKSTLTTSVNGIIIHFGGGEGNETWTTDLSLLQYCESKNFLVCNFRSLSSQSAMYGIPFWHITPNTGMDKFKSMEVDLALDALFDVARNDPMFSALFNTNTPVFLVGHSRGAVVVGSWGELMHGVDRSIYKSKVKCIGCNSPAGSSAAANQTGNSQPYMSFRVAGGFAQKTNVKMLYTAGSRDYTHLTRSEIERIYRSVDNPKVKIKILNNGDGGLSPFASNYIEWFDEVVAFGNAP